MKLFYSYSHKDERRRDKLETHLAPMKQEGLLETWHDRCISPGTDWHEAIDSNLEEADIVLLLISPDFIASDYCYAKEAHRAIERHESGATCVIPTLIRPVDWTNTSFAHLQALPRDARPVSLWRNPDSAWLDVARGIRRAVVRLREKRAGLESAKPKVEIEKDREGVIVYLSSELFGFTRPWSLDLSLPAGTALDRLAKIFDLPQGFDYQGRIGMRFDYQLVHNGHELVRERSLQVQHVRKGDALVLQAKVKSFAASEAASNSVQVYRGKRDLLVSKDAANAGRDYLEKLFMELGC